MQENEDLNIKTERRTLGVHLTSSDLFLKFIYPEIKNKVYNFVWVDLFAGEGNLIFPILEKIDNQKRIEFFKNHVFLSDIQEEMVQTCVKKAQSYNIPVELAKKNIMLRDNLQSYPKFLKKREFPIFHITNPPYLYLGYIRKQPETQNHLSYFGKENEGYQDLYQIAMINDLRNEIKNLIYIIPTNFLFGSSVSNKFRLDFLKFYDIKKMYIFETQEFEFTGTNILIGFFERQRNPSLNITEFEGLKFKKDNKKIKRKYRLLPKYNYRAGSEFEEFLEKYRCRGPLKVDYYLQKKEVDKNSGNQHIRVIDTNQYKSKKYKKGVLEVNRELKKKVKGNILYVKTVDTGSLEGRVGLNNIKKDFGVDGIFVSGNTYRTTPIQIFLEPQISVNSQKLLREYFNLILEYYRKELDSEFLTTYKYSNADYTRKYLGLRQVRKLIKTFPILEISNKNLENLIQNIREKNLKKLIRLIGNYSVGRN
jgi:hypothetical protein